MTDITKTKVFALAQARMKRANARFKKLSRSPRTSSSSSRLGP